MTTRILVVDDEPALLGLIVPLLLARGYEASAASTGRGALAAVDRDPPGLILLDLSLPDLDGLEVCRIVRADHATPILVLSGRDQESDKVTALDAGADDYITKPFGCEELLARIRATLRRCDAWMLPARQLSAGDLLIDLDRRRVTRARDEIRLTPKEFELLVLLVRNYGRVVTRRALLRAIWGANAVDQPEHVRVLIGALRKKIEVNPAKPRYLLTEPWVGYRFAGEMTGEI